MADIRWDNECTLPQANNRAQCQQLINLCQDYYLDQIVDSPTRVTEYTNNILDLFFTNNKTLINKCEVLPGIADHEAVFIESSLRPIKAKKAPRKVYIYKKAEYTKMRDELSSYINTFASESQDMNANDSWVLFEQKIRQLINTYIPSKMISGNKVRKPWIDRTLRSKHKLLKKLYNRQSNSRNTKDKQRYIKERNQTQKMERQAYWRYVESLIEEDPPDMDQQPSKQKKFWNYIKSLRKDNCGVAPLKDKGKMHSDPLDKANILNQQYQSVFTQEDTSSIPIPDGNPSPTMPDIEVTTEGILSLLKRLNPNKATGPDLIPARIFKELAEQCAPYLHIIYVKCLNGGGIPDVWKQANVSAIYKKGERFKASNYRPVSLTCICFKMLEHIVVSNIMRHFDKNEILTDCQHGFRKRRSCETQILTLVDELVKSLEKGKQHDLAVLDFSKAFDKVPHSRLLSKLTHYGIRGNTLTWIKDFLSNRSQRVIVDGATSEPAPVTSGVPQGSVLGPTLFLAFINDLPLHVQSSARLFADDCVIYREINSVADSLLLQQDLHSLAEWERQWGMSFHPEKCTVLRVHRKRSPIMYDYTLKGHIFEPRGLHQILRSTHSTKHLMEFSH